MAEQAAIEGQGSGHNPQLTVDVHYGRFLILDPAVQLFRARIRRDMPNINFESMMNAGDRWFLSVRGADAITGMAVFSGTREHPMMDFYYAVDPATTSVLMTALNQWRKR